MSEKLRYQFMGCVDGDYYWVATAPNRGMSVLTCSKKFFWANTGLVREIALHQRDCQCAGCLLREAREWKKRTRGILDAE